MFDLILNDLKSRIGMTSFFVVLSFFAWDIIYFLGTLRASNRMFRQMLGNLLRCSITFHQITPTGRILARLSYDTDVVDSRLPVYIRNLIRNSFRVRFFSLSQSSSIFVFCLFIFEHVLLVNVCTKG